MNNPPNAMTKEKYTSPKVIIHDLKATYCLSNPSARVDKTHSTQDNNARWYEDWDDYDDDDLY